jgi:hypothetical protein
MAAKEVPIDHNFRKILYEQGSKDDTAIGPRFLEEYFPKERPSISYLEVIPIFSEVFLQATIISLFLVILHSTRTFTLS